MTPYIDYCGDRIPLHNGKSARSLYNLRPDQNIDDFAAGTEFTDDGDLFDGEPFGAAYEDRRTVFDLQECKERAEFAERNGATIYDATKRFGIPCKNQADWPLCWGYGICSAAECNYAMRYNRFIELSPEVTALEATGGRLRGGWAKEWLDVAVEDGIVPQRFVRPRDRSQHRTLSAEAAQARKEFVPTEVVHFKRGDMAALRSALVSGIAGGMGLMWWGHLVMFGIWHWHPRYGELWGYRNSHSKRFGNNGWAFTTTGPATHGGGSAVLVA